MSDPAPVEPVVEAAAPATEAVASPAWDGDFASLDTQPWWKEHVPETARDHFAKLHGDRTYLHEVLSAEEPAKLLQEKLDGLQKSLGEEVTKQRTAAEQYKLEADRYKGDARRLQDELDDQVLSKRDADVKFQYPDIYAHVQRDEKGQITGGAVLDFARLTNAGYDDEAAAKMVRAMHADALKPAEPMPPLQPRAKAEPPAHVATMGRGTSNAEEAKRAMAPASVPEKMRQLNRLYEQEEGA
jgi:hypothetical protein